jgi:hypothetical protein
MVGGASRLGETSGSASDERLHLEEVPAFRISSGQVGMRFWHRLRGAGDLRGGSRGGAGPVSATPWLPSVNPPGSGTGALNRDRDRNRNRNRNLGFPPCVPEEGEITIKITITIKKEILKASSMADQAGVARPCRCSAWFSTPKG